MIVGGLLVWLVAGSGCQSRVPYHPDDPKILRVEGVDIDQTLEIATYRFQYLEKYQSLGLWIMRDQVILPAQAERVASLYLQYIDAVQDDFDRWHLTWAIRNLYTQGDDTVQEILHEAYLDAKQRAKKQGGIADKMVNHRKVYYGDYHGLARSARRSMMVVPGNDRYVQSVAEYRKKHPYPEEQAKAEQKAARKRARRGEPDPLTEQELQEQAKPKGGVEDHSGS